MVESLKFKVESRMLDDGCWMSSKKSIASGFSPMKISNQVLALAKYLLYNEKRIIVKCKNKNFANLCNSDSDRDKFPINRDNICG